MPEFLEKKLRAEYGNNPRAIYGTMNNIGAMHGNKETAKGREMEKKHMAKQSAPTQQMREMRIEIHRGKDGKVTGKTVHHHMMPQPTSKSGAFMEETHHSFPFGPKDHDAMMDHIDQHLGASTAKAAPAAQAAPDDGAEEDEEA